MRRLPFLLCSLTLLLAVPASAPASGSGGASAPASSGGTTYGSSVPDAGRAARLPARPVARVFKVAPGTLKPGAAARFAYRIDGRMSAVHVAIVVRRAGSRSATAKLRLGYQLTGERHGYRWKRAGKLKPGRYAVELRARDQSGHALQRVKGASGRSRVTVAPPPPPPAPAPPPAVAPGGVFPVAGPYSLGGADARFGAGRPGHIHQGQDISAAAGTPVVAPLAATARYIAFQKGGAGHFVVLHAVDGRDFVFMHLQTGSITVVQGGALAAGAQFARVGSTGSSTGPHLHFEIWPGGWYTASDSQPIDPLPQLLAWAGTR
jgi:murein DD-endopeptidase MepM/ murein hydrolase activator NlpD